MKDIISTLKKDSKPPSSAIVTHLNELEKLFNVKVPQYKVKEEEVKKDDKKDNKDNKDNKDKKAEEKKDDKDKKKEDKFLKELKLFYDQSKAIRKSYFCHICDWES